MRRAVAVGIGALLLAGCGGDDGKVDPKKISGPAKEVAETVMAFQTATAAGDFRKVCNELLSAEVRRATGGRDCPEVERERARHVRRPRIELKRIEVTAKGARASARVRATADGQKPVEETILLVRERGRYRISSLGR